MFQAELFLKPIMCPRCDLVSFWEGMLSASQANQTDVTILGAINIYLYKNQICNASWPVKTFVEHVLSVEHKNVNTTDKS